MKETGSETERETERERERERDRQKEEAGKRARAREFKREGDRECKRPMSTIALRKAPRKLTTQALLRPSDDQDSSNGVWPFCQDLVLKRAENSSLA